MIIKKLSVLCITLFSSALLACPQLEGIYRCSVGGNVTETTITQDLRNGTWTYVVSGEDATLDVIADGRNYTVNNIGEIRNANYTANCTNLSLIVDASGDVYSDGRRIGRGKSILVFAKDASSNNLIAQTTISVGNFSLPTRSVTCPKI